MDGFLSNSRARLFAGIGVIVLAAIGWYFLRPQSSPYQTLVVHAGNFSEEVTVSGSVTAAHSVDLGFAQGGRVSFSSHDVGDTVVSGTVLAEVENGDLRAAVSQRQAALAAAQANLDALMAGTRSEELAVTQAQIESDQSALAQANQALATAIESAYTSSDDAIHNKVDQFFSNPRSSSPTVNFTSSNSQLITTLQNDRLSIENVLSAWQHNAMSLGANADLGSAISFAQGNISQVSKVLSDANAALNQAIPTQSTTQATINGYIASVAAARTALDTAKSALDSATAAQRAAQALLTKDQKTLALQHAGATQQSIDAARAQVAAAQAEVANAEAQLQKTEIIAPFSGTVVKMDAKVGSIANPNTPVISLISRGTLEIECFVPEVNIAAVAVGNPATTTLDAYGAGVTFAAKVIAIDPAQTMTGGVPTYKTTLVFDKPDPRVKPGMTANVSIATGELAHAIVIPKGAVFLREGFDTVQLLADGKPVDTKIQTRPTTLGFVVVTQGLSDGDVLILNPDVSK